MSRQANFHRNKYLNGDLIDWANFIIKLDNIGYSSSSSEAKVLLGPGTGVFSSKCFEVIMPERVKKINDAVTAMPDELRTLVYYKYIADGHKNDTERAMAYATEQSSTKSAYRKFSEGLFWWLSCWMDKAQ